MAGDNKKTVTFRKAEPADRSLLVAHLLSSPGTKLMVLPFRRRAKSPVKNFSSA